MEKKPKKPKIDANTYAVESYNYYHTKHKKNQIIIAGSLRKENYHIKRLQKRDYGKTKKWNTFTIDRNGNIYQHFDPKCYSDYMGIKDVDKNSISIVLENMGMVFYDFETGKFLNWIHEICDDDLVYEKNWKSCRYWEKYSEEQFISLVELCKYLCSKYNINLDTLGYNVHHEDTPKFKGIVCRSNFDHSYDDLNPSFDFKRFLDTLDIDY